MVGIKTKDCQNFLNSLVSKLSAKAVARRCSTKETFLEILQNSHEDTCVKVSLLMTLQDQACNFIKKESPVQVFSGEFSKTTLYITPWGNCFCQGERNHFRNIRVVTNKYRK